ncbi:FAD-dependent oxidoreductase [Rhodohalobacter sp.]|uniref:FAD-dependent oxidoreductase n=1 Tax=Rhodohalobacter sp. TaxID=1974210 RepID=UPI00356A9F61
MDKVDVIIVGGGPVGLYLAGRLLQSGFSCRVFEQREKIDIHSKSLGIHPVSLDLFDRAGITQPFLKEGLKIEFGLAFFDEDPVGEVSFQSCPPPHSYILAIPQWNTETLLEKWVKTLDSEVLVRGAKVEQLENSDHQVSVTYSIKESTHKISSDYVIGCDGKNSFVRNSCDISFDGSSYPDTYIMGDFDDNTAFGENAAVFLHRDGLVESFPLPNGQRRWVVKTDHFIKNPEESLITEQVFRRTNLHLGECKNYMLSSFGVQHLLAETFHKNRVLLAGDSAHVVSPIGGQGMNLGWIDAEECLSTLIRVLDNSSDKEDHLNAYSTKQRKIAKQVAKRAEINMRLGRKESANFWTRSGLKIVLKSPLKHLLARIFTMRGLGSWPI